MEQEPNKSEKSDDRIGLKPPALPAPMRDVAGQLQNYNEFFLAFNQQRYFEAHEVLEAIWLPRRQTPIADFYKGLIQLAGAFVHIQKDRREPAKALLKLAKGNLSGYVGGCEDPELLPIMDLIDLWMDRLEIPNRTPRRELDAAPPCVKVPRHP